MTYFYASSHTMLLVKWIKDGMIIPPKQMASFYALLFKFFFSQTGTTLFFYLLITNLSVLSQLTVPFFLSFKISQQALANKRMNN